MKKSIRLITVLVVLAAACATMAEDVVKTRTSQRSSSGVPSEPTLQINMERCIRGSPGFAQNLIPKTYMVCMVILGGMENIAEVIIGTLLLVIIPEKNRAFEDYRMLFYGLVLIFRLLFRPQGIIPSKPRCFNLMLRG